MAGAPRGTVPLRQIVSEAAQEIGYKPKSGGDSDGWKAAIEKISNMAGQVPMANGMVKRNPVKGPAPIVAAQAHGGAPAGAPPLPLGVVLAKAAAKKRTRGG